MATVNKDFRVKHGLVVEGTSAVVNGSNVLTEASTTFLNNLIQDQAGSLLENATLTNIAITYDDATNALVITAESGVADATTDDLDEGNTNLYFTDERAQDAFALLLSNGTVTGASFTYDDATNKVTLTIDDQWTGKTTDDLTEGNTNKYFTNQRALDATSSAYDAAGSAATAQANAEDYADGLAVNYDPAGAAATAQSNAEAYADGLAVNYDVAGAAATVQGNLDTHTNSSSAHGVTGSVVGTSDSQTLTNKTMGDDLLMDGFQISGLGIPTQPDHAATKSYVDAVSEGLNVHEAVRAATSGNVSIATGLENGDSAGGVTLATGDRILVKSQTTASENGIYVVQASGQALRATDFDTATEVVSGDFVFVSSGTYANTGWVQTLNPATIGTDPISFTQFSGAGTFLAGNGLLIDGNTFSIDTTITADLASSQTLTNKTIDAAVNTLSNIPNSSLDNDSITINGTATALGGNVTLDTDDISEGTTNKYFADELAVDAVATALSNGTHTNITVTYNDNANSISIAADAGSILDTDVSFTSVAINSIVKQVAAQSNINGTFSGTAYSFAKSAYRSAKFLVKIDNGTHNEITEVLLTLDSSDNVAITEYAIVGTNGSRGTISATVSGSNVLLTVTPTDNSEVTVYGTLMV